ncbi:MAG: class I SAM-dependent methyltransferase [Acidimicrobiales bacterium]
MEEPVAETDRSRGLRQRVRDLTRVVPRKMYVGLARAHHELALEKRHLQHIYETWVPPGHFYSPFPDLIEFDKRAEQLLSVETRPEAIALREDEQLDLLHQLAEFLRDVPFPVERTDDFRYYFDNPAYAWGDGLILHAMLRHVRPQRVVEVGSGYSSAMVLDTTERWLSPDVELTFIEPYSELLRSLLRPGDDRRVKILEFAVQDVEPDVFAKLQAGDILFIDSTHVVKAGSDVNYLFFEVLPRLAAGVVVHIHDIFFPFEYPVPWVHEGRAWQESYLLRAFLMYNPTFEITWFQHLMWSRHRPVVEGVVPDIARNPGGNLWLRKVS